MCASLKAEGCATMGRLHCSAVLLSATEMSLCFCALVVYFRLHESRARRRVNHRGTAASKRLVEVAVMVCSGSILNMCVFHHLCMLENL